MLDVLAVAFGVVLSVLEIETAPEAVLVLVDELIVSERVRFVLELHHLLTHQVLALALRVVLLVPVLRGFRNAAWLDHGKTPRRCCCRTKMKAAFYFVHLFVVLLRALVAAVTGQHQSHIFLPEALRVH